MISHFCSFYKNIVMASLALSFVMASAVLPLNADSDDDFFKTLFGDDEEFAKLLADIDKELSQQQASGGGDFGSDNTGFSLPTKRDNQEVTESKAVLKSTDPRELFIEPPVDSTTVDGKTSYQPCNEAFIAFQSIAHSLQKSLQSIEKKAHSRTNNFTPLFHEQLPIYQSIIDGFCSDLAIIESKKIYTRLLLAPNPTNKTIVANMKKVRENMLAVHDQSLKFDNKIIIADDQEEELTDDISDGLLTLAKNENKPFLSKHHKHKPHHKKKGSEQKLHPYAQTEQEILENELADFFTTTLQQLATSLHALTNSKETLQEITNRKKEREKQVENARQRQKSMSRSHTSHSSSSSSSSWGRGGHGTNRTYSSYAGSDYGSGYSGGWNSSRYASSYGSNLSNFDHYDSYDANNTPRTSQQNLTNMAKDDSRIFYAGKDKKPANEASEKEKDLKDGISDKKNDTTSAVKQENESENGNKNIMISGRNNDIKKIYNKLLKTLQNTTSKLFAYLPHNNEEDDVKIPDRLLDNNIISMLNKSLTKIEEYHNEITEKEVELFDVARKEEESTVGKLRDDLKKYCSALAPYILDVGTRSIDKDETLDPSEEVQKAFDFFKQPFVQQAIPEQNLEKIVQNKHEKMLLQFQQTLDKKKLLSPELITKMKALPSSAEPYEILKKVRQSHDELQKSIAYINQKINTLKRMSDLLKQFPGHQKRTNDILAEIKALEFFRNASATSLTAAEQL